MNTKKLIWFGVGAVLLTTGTIIAVKMVKKKREEKAQAELEKLKEQQLQEMLQTSEQGQLEETKYKGMVVAQRDAFTKSITNAYNDIKGKKLYPAKQTSDPANGHPMALGYANLRTSPEVNTDRGWYDPSDNLIKKYVTGSDIGTIIGEQYDDMNPKNRWFKVKMSKPCCGVFSDYTEGWVRSDNVSFKPFKKGTKSSFDGAFVEKYDTSYPLGADVFPHSNWMIGYSASSNDVTSDFEGNLDLNI